MGAKKIKIFFQTQDLNSLGNKIKKVISSITVSGISLMNNEMKNIIKVIKS